MGKKAANNSEYLSGNAAVKDKKVPSLNLPDEAASKSDAALVERIRAFNRFYMPRMNLLGNHYLGSEYSATEARILFEIYEHDGCNAATIAKTMNIDKSYLSRIIAAHEKKGYLTKKPSETDNRVFDLHLTSSGLKRSQEFISMSNNDISEMVSRLNAQEKAQLLEALDTLTSLLSK